MEKHNVKTAWSLHLVQMHRCLVSPHFSSQPRNFLTSVTHLQTLSYNTCPIGTVSLQQNQYLNNLYIKYLM
uniref:Uncharacterized protein n=1 Tax=Anguilla anguilla TaxID=7936 RepID=A0A0E9WXZ6_ANGAN